MTAQPEGKPPPGVPGPPPATPGAPFSWASNIGECVAALVAVVLATYLLQTGTPEGWRFYGAWLLIIGGSAAMIRSVERMIARWRRG